MNLTNRARKAPGTALFARNKRDYLEWAVKRPTTFREDKPWVSAKAALEEFRRLTIYFVPSPSSAEEEPSESVEFEAEITHIEINPALTEAMERLIEECIDEAKEWVRGQTRAGQQGTIYRIAQCRRLRKQDQFPFTQLEKLSGHGTLDPGFQRSYALVYRRVPTG